ncbi:endonuclease/exonuclease/phosphatase family protein [Chryseolinea sp. T2]|uniref:endonuclease/exonuclease/phosphatase family protein n=1 Tax=Chryseolinea sp. T2 TaxID=3129255 RepID=UPI00307745E5
MFTLMTWNLENLFRPAQADSSDVKQAYQLKLQLLGAVIAQHDPDMIALQEVGGLEPLSDLQAACSGNYPHAEVSLFPDDRGIRVAVLSKKAIVEREDLVDFPPGPACDINNLTAGGGTIPIVRMGRGALRVRVAHNGGTIDVIAAHLKSKLLTFPRPGGNSAFSTSDERERAQVAGIALMKRSAEAVTLRTRISDFLKGNKTNPLILAGDFNDVPEAQTSLILCGPPGSEIGTRGFDQTDAGDDQRLWNLTNAITDPARRFSRIHNGRGEMLDQIFVSEELLPVQANNKRKLPTVDSLIDFAQMPSIGDNPNERATAPSPDHAPVKAVFDV